MSARLKKDQISLLIVQALWFSVNFIIHLAFDIPGSTEDKGLCDQPYTNF